MSAWCLATFFKTFEELGFSDSTLIRSLHRFRTDGGLARISDFFALPSGKFRTGTAHSFRVKALTHILSVLKTLPQVRFFSPSEIARSTQAKN
jgi:hypothetical protein